MTESGVKHTTHCQSLEGWKLLLEVVRKILSHQKVTEEKIWQNVYNPLNKDRQRVNGTLVRKVYTECIKTQMRIRR